MKLLIIGLAMLLTVTLLCYANQNYLKASLGTVIHDLDTILVDLQNEKWESADEITKSIIDGWFAKKGYYMSVVTHEHIHSVETALIELQCSIENRVQEEAIKSARVVQTQLENLLSEEVLSLASAL